MTHWSCACSSRLALTFAASRPVEAGGRAVAQESIPTFGACPAVHARLRFALRRQDVARRPDGSYDWESMQIIQT